MNRLKRVWIAILVIALLGAGQLNAQAAVNAVLGGIGGINNGTLIGGDGTGNARIEINAVNLALVKQARDLTGTILADGTNVSAGQEIYFLLFVDNPTAGPALDLRLTDVIDDIGFTYLDNSIETSLSPTGASDAAIWSAAWTPLTDAIGAPDDTASCQDTNATPGRDLLTIGAEPAQINQQLDIPAGSLRAIRFRVRVN
jgi:hypothetical protein